jgi:hypothetical protein
LVGRQARHDRAQEVRGGRFGNVLLHPLASRICGLDQVGKLVDRWPLALHFESCCSAISRGLDRLGVRLEVLRRLLQLLRGRPVAIAIIDRGVIAREERYLERKFGAPYTDYKRHVRRWV